MNFMPKEIIKPFIPAGFMVMLGRLTYVEKIPAEAIIGLAGPILTTYMKDKAIERNGGTKIVNNTA